MKNLSYNMGGGGMNVVAALALSSLIVVVFASSDYPTQDTTTSGNYPTQDSSPPGPASWNSTSTSTSTSDDPRPDDDSSAGPTSSPISHHKSSIVGPVIAGTIGLLFLVAKLVLIAYCHKKKLNQKRLHDDPKTAPPVICMYLLINYFYCLSFNCWINIYLLL